MPTNKKNKSRGPGRPPKNTIGGKGSNKKGPGRPPKNIIKPRSTKTTNSKTKNQKTKTNYKTNKKTNFSHHKINKKKDIISTIILIISFLIFLSSIIYKFYYEKKPTEQEPLITPELIITKDGKYIIPEETNTKKNNIIKENKQNNENFIEFTKKIKEKQTNNKSGYNVNKTNNTGTNKLNNTKTGNIRSTGNKINLNYGNKIKIPSYKFIDAYKKNEENDGVIILQKFLYNEGLYTGEFNGIYTEKTINAVYNFQQKYNIITPQTSTKAYGWLGPSTRKKINSMIN